MNISLRWRWLDELGADDLQAWTALGLRAGPQPNVFAMPQFVLPAARWLAPSQRPVLAWLENTTAELRELFAVGAFTIQRPNLFVPLPHLRGFRTPHTPRGGLLVAQGQDEDAMRTLLAALREDARWRALDLHNLPLRASGLQSMLPWVQSRGGAWFQRRAFARPILDLYAGGTAYAHVESKDRRRRRRRLAEQGTLEFHLLQGTQADAHAVDRHLQLEHAGWKGEAGSSLLSSATQATFFREMFAGFAMIGLAAFMETRLDGRAIASSSNLLLGDTLNGIKIGWDPAFATCSPGRLNETELHRLLPERLPQARTYDSQSQERSYLADMLPHRMEVATGTLALDRGAVIAMRAARAWRPLAWRLQADA